MATANLPMDGSANPIQVLRPGTNQSTDFGAGSTVIGTPLNSATRVIRVLTTEFAHIVLSGTAAVTDTPIPANIPEYFSVNGGETIAMFNAAGASGTFHITEME